MGLIVSPSPDLPLDMTLPTMAPSVMDVHVLDAYRLLATAPELRQRLDLCRVGPE